MRSGGVVVAQVVGLIGDSREAEFTTLTARLIAIPHLAGEQSWSVGHHDISGLRTTPIGTRMVDAVRR